MSDPNRFPSPDGRYYVARGAHEMRMSHWVFPAELWDARAERLLVAIGDWQWSTDYVEWDSDSSRVTVNIRRYPGDAPSIVLDLHPGERLAVPHAPAETAPIPFDGLLAFLESFYRDQRRRS